MHLSVRALSGVVSTELWRYVRTQLGIRTSTVVVVATAAGVTALLLKPVRSTLFARLHARGQHVQQRLVDDRRRAMFAEIRRLSSDDHTPLNIVEIGTSLIQNVSFYPTNSEITCVTTGVYRMSDIRRLEQQYPYVSVVFCKPADMTSLADDTVDVVVSTLSLCIADDIERTLTEIRRVLKEGGHFYFVEHATAEDEAVTSLIRKWCSFWWRLYFYGCRVDSRLARILRTSNFRKLEIQHVCVDIDTGLDQYLGSLLNNVINMFATYMIGARIVGLAVK